MTFNIGDKVNVVSVDSVDKAKYLNRTLVIQDISDDGIKLKDVDITEYGYMYYSEKFWKESELELATLDDILRDMEIKFKEKISKLERRIEFLETEEPPTTKKSYISLKNFFRKG